MRKVRTGAPWISRLKSGVSPRDTTMRQVCGDQCPARHSWEPGGRGAVARTGTERRSRARDGGQSECGGGGGGGGGHGVGSQPAGPVVRGAADRGDHLREPAGVSQRVHGEGAEDHHQLLHRQPGRGGPDAGGAGAAALRLLRGEFTWDRQVWQTGHWSQWHTHCAPPAPGAPGRSQGPHRAAWHRTSTFPFLISFRSLVPSGDF